MLSNSTRKLLWFEISKPVIAVLKKNKFIVLFIIIFGTLSFSIAYSSLLAVSGRHRATKKVKVAHTRLPSVGFRFPSHPSGWWRGTVVERRSLAGELSLSCA